MFGLELKIGTWVAFTADGLWYSPFWEGSGYQAAFKTKKELVKDIAAATMDARATPLVKRAGAHRYIYRIP